MGSKNTVGFFTNLVFFIINLCLFYFLEPFYMNSNHKLGTFLMKREIIQYNHAGRL